MVLLVLARFVLPAGTVGRVLKTPGSSWRFLLRHGRVCFPAVWRVGSAEQLAWFDEQLILDNFRGFELVNKNVEVFETSDSKQGNELGSVSKEQRSQHGCL